MFKCIEAGESGWEEFKLVSLVIRECHVNDEPDQKKNLFIYIVDRNK